MFLSDATVPAAPSGGTPLSVVVILAVIAVVPGLYAAWISNKARKDSARNDQSNVGIELTKVGADLLQEEIGALRSERERWTEERERWHTERVTLTGRMEELQYAINRLIIVLESNSIEVPDTVRQIIRRSA